MLLYAQQIGSNLLERKNNTGLCYALLMDVLIGTTTHKTFFLALFTKVVDTHQSLHSAI